MDLELKDRSALITGGASGIGKAIAIALAEQGARVVVADVNDESGQALAGEIHGRAIRCDVTDESSVQSAIQNVIANEGQLDIMVNNAGIGGQPMPLIKGEAADWDRLYQVNLRGVFFGIKHASQVMKSGGSIINVSSIAGMGGAMMLGPYGATKAAVIQLTQTAALELAQAGIRVNVICPGWTDTPMLDVFERSRLAQQVPLGRIGKPDEIAGLVVYLASSASSFVTGSVFRIDGGIKS